MNTQSITANDNHTGRAISPWAWFGAQVGSTLWLVRAASSLGWDASPDVLYPVLICFVVPNIVGLALWFRRRQLGEWTALRSLLLAIAVCTFVAMGVLKRTPQFSGELSVTAFIAVAGILAVLFVFVHRRESRR
jgi:uncharacterized membrane protein YfcA